MKHAFLYALLLGLFISCNSKGNDSEHKLGFFQKLFGVQNDKTESQNKATESGKDSLQLFDYEQGDNQETSSVKVYACAYDGYAALRSKPSSKAQKIGELRNGPKGAILLNDLGKWVKVNVDGTVGYVYSEYIQYTPTIPYTGDVELDWITGVWHSGFQSVVIFDNGYWEGLSGWIHSKGYYIMQNNEVKLVTVIARGAETNYKWVKADSKSKAWTQYVKDNGAEKETILKINSGKGMLDTFVKMPFLRNQEDGDAENINYTKAYFKKAAKQTAREVQKFLK